MKRDQLIAMIEQFALENNVAPATVTSRAVGNSRLYARLKNGAGCTIAVAERILDFIEKKKSSCHDRKDVA